MGMREFQARHQALQAIEANQSQTQGQPIALSSSAEHDVLMIALKNDVNAVRAFPTFDMRAEYKRDKFLPKWLPFVDQYFEKGKVYQNDIIGFCIVYLFDVGDFDRALSLAHKAIAQNQSLPAQFSSNLPTFVADQIYKWADKTASVGLSVEPYFSQTFQHVATAWKLHEVVTAKWLKLAAALLLRNTDGKVQASGIDDPEKLILAIALCSRAFQFNPKAGVKTMIDRCLMRLSALAQAGEYNPDDFLPVVGLSLEPVQIDFDLVVKKLSTNPPLEEKTDV